MAQQNYCSQTDVTNHLTVDGVSYRIADNPPTELGNAIGEASDEIEEYLLRDYDTACLAGNSWVRNICAAIASYILCERGGNAVPPGIVQKYERAIRKLEQVRLGIIQVPGCGQRRDNVPVLSNVRVRLDPYPHTVVERSRSTGQPTDYVQSVDRLDWGKYVI